MAIQDSPLRDRFLELSAFGGLEAVAFPLDEHAQGKQQGSFEMPAVPFGFLADINQHSLLLLKAGLDLCQGVCRVLRPTRHHDCRHQDDDPQPANFHGSHDRLLSRRPGFLTRLVISDRCSRPRPVPPDSRASWR